MITSCAAVLGRWDCCPRRRRPKTKAFRPTKGTVGGVRAKIDRYVVERHFFGIWERAGLQASAPAGGGRAFGDLLRRDVAQNPSALLLIRRRAPFGSPPPPHQRFNCTMAAKQSLAPPVPSSLRGVAWRTPQGTTAQLESRRTRSPLRRRLGSRLMSSPRTQRGAARPRSTVPAAASGHGCGGESTRAGGRARSPETGRCRRWCLYARSPRTCWRSAPKAGRHRQGRHRGWKRPRRSPRPARPAARSRRAPS